MDDGSLFEERSIPTKITSSIMVRSIPLLEGTGFHECKVLQWCNLQGTHNEFFLVYMTTIAWITTALGDTQLISQEPLHPTWLGLLQTDRSCPEQPSTPASLGIWEKTGDKSKTRPGRRTQHPRPETSWETRPETRERRDQGGRRSTSAKMGDKTGDKS